MELVPEADKILKRVMETTGFSEEEAVNFIILLFHEMLDPCSQRGDFTLMVEKAMRKMYGLDAKPRMRIGLPKRRRQ